MKRDVRLHGLSSEHYHALVLAGQLRRAGPRWTRADGTALAERFATELEPHFRVEEDVLLSALREAKPASAEQKREVLRLIAQTEADHAALRALVDATRDGDGEAARQMGERLHDHVRFEERELFGVCERVLPAAVLEEVARRVPK